MKENTRTRALGVALAGLVLAIAAFASASDARTLGACYEDEVVTNAGFCLPQDEATFTSEEGWVRR